MENQPDAPRLSLDLVLLVIEQLDRFTLKQCRLVSHAFNKYATSELFRELHLARTIQSHQHAMEISRNAHLSIHVRKFVYHVGILLPTYQEVDAFRRRVTWLREEEDVPLLNSYEIEQLHVNYIRELALQREYNNQPEYDRLGMLACRLPSLEAVESRHPHNNEYHPRGYTEARTGLPTYLSPQDASSSFWLLLLLTADRRLTSIVAVRLKIWLFYDIAQKLPERFQNLNDLHELRLSISEWLQTKQLRFGRQPFARLLASTPSLRQLDLEFRESTQSTLEVFCKDVLQCRWESLWDLSITGFLASEDDLVQFLSTHASTLKRLRIERLSMPWKNGNGDLCASGSILSLFCHIKSFCNLNTAELAGKFSNSHDEAWFANTDVDELQCYRVQLQDYMCHRGPFPVPRLERQVGKTVSDIYRITDHPHVRETLSVDLAYNAMKRDRSLQRSDEVQPCALSDASWAWRVSLLFPV